MNHSSLGQHFRKLRTEKHQTLYQVSKETDIDTPMLSKIERGARMPTMVQLERLCSYFNVSEADIKAMHTAERIIQKFGLNKTTYQAIKMLAEQIPARLKN
jgi:transcriptional regulator with XRE-family HTH domain